MVVGHLAVALGAKRIEPRVTLPVLVAAVFGLDILWPVFVLAGLETVRIDPGNTAFTPLDFVNYPWSHSLLMSLVWGAIAGHFARVGFQSVRAGLVVGALVVSHWLLDFVVHRPDLPLWPGGPRVGLGLWQSIPGTLVVEGLLFAAGIAIYLRTTRAIDGQGRWGLVALLVTLGALWASSPFGPPPPSVTAVAIVGVVMAVVIPVWAAWIERHRAAVRGS
jgi:membrane-bound metal-dependent hydrolase YbcI (DUF457 family)